MKAQVKMLSEALTIYFAIKKSRTDWPSVG